MNRNKLLVDYDLQKIHVRVSPVELLLPSTHNKPIHYKKMDEWSIIPSIAYIWIKLFAFDEFLIKY